MKVLVTGGAGFIGSHIVDALLAQGHQVVVVDDLSTGLVENIDPRARFYRMSLLDEGLGEILAQERPQVVSHQAAHVDLRKSMAEPVVDAQVNILGSLNLLTHCLRLGVERVIYASSAAVYGEPEYLPVDEKHPINPLSPYGTSKHAVEHYLKLFPQQKRLSYVVLRYSNVYGPRQNPRGEAGVVAIFSQQMLRGERPTIFGPGDKTRDYIHAQDVVAANLLALEKGENGIYDISTGIETTDQQVFDSLAQLLDYKGSPIYAPVREGEVYRICLDWGRARAELGWSPRLSWEEGLALTIPYYRKQVKPASR